MASQSKGMTPKQQELFDKLTTLQKRVCTNILNGMTRPQAYKEAGGRAKGDAVNNVVSVMMMNVQVKTFMDEMYSYDMNQSVMTREEAMEIMSGFARAPGVNHRVRIQATERLAKMQGWDAAQKHDLTGHLLTSEVPLTDAQRAVLDRAMDEDV